MIKKLAQKEYKDTIRKILKKSIKTYQYMTKKQVATKAMEIVTNVFCNA